MTSPNVTAALDELAAAILAIEPEIRGHESLSNDALSDETRSFVLAELSRRRELLGLYRRAVEELEALDAAGFPDIPDAVVPVSVADELHRQQAAIQAAIQDFTVPTTASELILTIGEAIPKTGS